MGARGSICGVEIVMAALALEASVLDEARQFVAWLHSQGAAQLEGIVMAMKEEERAALASLRDANPTGRGFA